jgi:predicted RNase H-like HicB family nuclease
VDQEEDGRWIAEIPDLRGVMAYGNTRGEALANVKPLALRVIAEQVEHSETSGDFSNLSFSVS